MLRQEASLPSVEEFAENRCGLNNELSIPPAVSHFTVGWTEEGRNPSPVEDVSQWALGSHSLVLIIVRPSICRRIDTPPDVVESPGMPLTPASQRGPVFAQLALHSAHTRTNLIWPEGGSFDWWFHYVSSATAIWPGSTAVRVPVCGCVHVWTTVWMWQWIRNLIQCRVRIFRTEMCRCGGIHMRDSSCSPVVCGATFPKRVTSCEPTLSRLC